MSNLGILILRLALGLLFIGHGSQKLFGWFGGHGLAGMTAMLQKSGSRQPRFWALSAALSEFGGGLLFTLGFLNPLGSLGIIAAMLVAIAQVHWPRGLWNTNGGFEFPLVNLCAALAIALTGPGTYSLDALLGLSLPEPLSLLIGLVFVIIGFFLEQYSLQPAVGTQAEKSE